MLGMLYKIWHDNFRLSSNYELNLAPLIYFIILHLQLKTDLYMPTLTTELLLLQEATFTDAPFIFELLNTPSWIQYIGDRKILTIEDAENYIQKSLITLLK